MQLSPNFKLSEFVVSDTAVRLGIDNSPEVGVIKELVKLASVMELVRAALNEQVPGTYIAVTSGFRCEKLERVITAKDYAAWCLRRKVERSPESWQVYFDRKAHPRGHGCDFHAPKFGTPLEIVRFIASRPDLMEHIDQVIEEGSWVHVGISDNPRHQVMSAKFNDGTPTYSKGLQDV